MIPRPQSRPLEEQSRVPVAGDVHEDPVAVRGSKTQGATFFGDSTNSTIGGGQFNNHHGDHWATNNINLFNCTLTLTNDAVDLSTLLQLPHHLCEDNGTAHLRPKERDQESIAEETERIAGLKSILDSGVDYPTLLIYLFGHVDGPKQPQVLETIKALTNHLSSEPHYLAKHQRPVSLPGHPDRLLILDDLLKLIRGEFIHDHMKEESIPSLWDQLKLPVTSDPSQARIQCLLRLGNALQRRYSRLNLMDDLEDAIYCFTEAASSSSPSHYRHLEAKLGLASSRFQLYLGKGRLELLIMLKSTLEEEQELDVEMILRPFFDGLSNVRELQANTALANFVRPPSPPAREQNDFQEQQATSLLPPKIEDTPTSLNPSMHDHAFPDTGLSRPPSSVWGGLSSSCSPMSISSMTVWMGSPHTSPGICYDSMELDTHDPACISQLDVRIGMGGVEMGGRGGVRMRIGLGSPIFRAGFSEEVDLSGRGTHVGIGEDSQTHPVAKANVTAGRTPRTSLRRRRQDAAFACTVPGCGSTFARAFNLKAHLRSHSKQKPYECQWPGCGKVFMRQPDYKRHRQLHSIFDPFECYGCQKQFSRIDALNRHLKSDGGKECLAVAELLRAAREKEVVGGQLMPSQECMVTHPDEARMEDVALGLSAPS